MTLLLDHSLLFRSSPYPYLVMDTGLTVIDANPAYLNAVQRTREDIVGRYVFDAFPENPDDPASTNIREVKESLETAIATGAPHTTRFLRYAVPVATPGGMVFEERFWSTVHTPGLREDGSVAFVIQNAIDVTDLYRFDRRSQNAELALDLPATRHSENFSRAQMHEAMARILKDERGHLRNLFNQAPGFVAVLTGPDHVFEMANEAYYQLVGHRDIIGKPVWEALPEVKGQGFEAHLRHVYVTGESWTISEAPLAVQRQANGPIERRYVDLVYQAYRAADGRILGVFAQGYDVTEAHNARVAERESDERLKEGLVAARMVVWDWDLASDALYMSENSAEVAGVLASHQADIEQFIHPDDRPILLAARNKALAERSAYRVAIRLIRPDTQATIWLDIRGHVRCDEQGRPIKVRGVAIDITDRMKAEQELREADRRKDEFLAMLAHELRNPLAPISTAAQVLKFAGNDPQRVRTTSDIISRQVLHMTNLIDDLIDVSRVTRGLIELDKTDVEVGAIVSNAVEQARPLLEARKHSLSISMGAGPAVVRGDRTRLVQVLSNLLNNAVKYTPQGGRISLSVLVTEAEVRIAVQDNGIGIEAALLPCLFDLFTQGQRTSDRSQGGLGLGLALVKSIMSMHRGRVEVDSPGAGQGSTFTITLPLLDLGRAELSTRPGRERPPNRALNIMVVDDNRDAAESLATLLEACGHQVRVAEDGKEAMKLALSHPPEVFILDIGLPGMNGYDLARHLRQVPSTAQALYIALTGYSQAHDRILSKAAGIAHHFVKPLDLGELEKILDAL